MHELNNLLLHRGLHISSPLQSAFDLGDFWEVDGDEALIRCILDTRLEPSSAGFCLVLLCFCFPREGSLDTREPLSDAREIVEELVARHGGPGTLGTPISTFA